MSIFDLLLIVLVLSTIACLAAALIALFSQRSIVFGRLIAGVMAAWIVYLAAGAGVAVLSPQHILAIGEDRCFDEMCFAVTDWNRMAAPGDKGDLFFVVSVRISNHSRGRAQREIGRKGILVDQSGRVYEVSNDGMKTLSPGDGRVYPGLDAKVDAGESLTTKLVFELPADAKYPAFTLGSNLDFNPARIVIGDEAHFLHKPTVVPLNGR